MRVRGHLGAGPVREEARYDGKYVLRINTGLSPEEVALAYRGCGRWMGGSRYVLRTEL
mgnify:CR=1 FL=1